MKIPCKLKYDGCEGSREIIFRRGINKSRVVKACKSCLKKHKEKYQKKYQKNYRRKRQKISGPMPVPPAAKVQAVRPESTKAKWGRTHVCKACGANPYPNYNFCPGTCHAQATRAAGDTETHDMPHVPISGIN